ncbi:putative lipoprotein [Streptococcus varani]|uniref:Putative lipoprotein n=1 Tax=Streptococcus varani TaxID=1608583 RepID=A0A0E3WFV4_9STRE|nr:C39 family peptidase [Streptococcus varani]CQR26192.1 putative lipoprotein [Streptococcus varani]
MKSKIIWSILSLFVISLGCITSLFLLKENPVYKDIETKEVAKSSKALNKTAGSNFNNEPKKNQQIQEETSKNLEEIGHSKLDKVDFAKPNPPITQETIDRLEKEKDKQYGVGDKIMLNVSPQVQRAWNTCAPTTVSMMLSSRGITVSQEVLAQEMKTDTTFGTHNANAIQILNRHLFGYDTPRANQDGYKLETVTTSDIKSEQMSLFKERLKQNIADGYPMYYTFDCAKIYPGSYGEHNVIGIGYQLAEDGSDITYLYYIDPSYTKQDSVYGGLKKVTPEELFEGMLTCVEPNYGW